MKELAHPDFLNWRYRLQADGPKKYIGNRYGELNHRIHLIGLQIFESLPEFMEGVMRRIIFLELLNQMQVKLWVRKARSKLWKYL